MAHLFLQNATSVFTGPKEERKETDFKLQANLKKYFGIDVGRRLIRHLMEIMQVAAIYPKPSLSIPNAMNKKFPYLLRNVTVNRVNQVWSTDIIYFRLKNGFAYLTAVID